MSDNQTKAEESLTEVTKISFISLQGTEDLSQQYVIQFIADQMLLSVNVYFSNKRYGKDFNPARQQ